MRGCAGLTEGKGQTVSRGQQRVLYPFPTVDAHHAIYTGWVHTREPE